MTNKDNAALEKKKSFKNTEIILMLNTLIIVDQNSKDMDFSIRHKNKSNYALLKQKAEEAQESLDEIGLKYGKREGNMFKFKYIDDSGVTVDNINVANEARAKIFDVEHTLDLRVVTIDTKLDPESGKTDTQGVVINQDQMNILEPIFQFTFQD